MKFTSITVLVAATQAYAVKDEAVSDTLKQLHSFVDTTQIDDTFSSNEYLASDASVKKDALWEKIIAESGSSGSFPSGLEIAGIFVEAMGPSFTTKGD
jgi:hypothetical protein